MEANAIELRLERIEQLIQANNFLSKAVFDINEVARYTGLSKQYIYKLSSKNLIPFYKPNGKNLYFRKEEIDSWLLRNRQDTVEEIETVAANIAIIDRHSAI